MRLVKVTATRQRDRLEAFGRQVLGEIPDDPHYWDRVCDVILRRMERDGIISSAEEGGMTVGDDGVSDHRRPWGQAGAAGQAGHESVSRGQAV